jgi:RNA polymerase sigma-70 factor (ECF subfamily)
MATSHATQEPARSFEDDDVVLLLGAVANGDQVAFDRLYTHFRSRVFGLAARIVIDRDQAQEVTQEVFLQLWQQAARFDPSRGSAISWVLRITHARAVDRIRNSHSSSVRDTRYAAAGHVADTDTVVEQALLREEQLVLRSALVLLSPVQRESIQLAYYSGLTTLEISERLGVRRATVKTRIRDGLIRLGAELRSPSEATPARTGSSAAASGRRQNQVPVRAGAMS